MVDRSSFCSLYSGAYGRQWLVDTFYDEYGSACTAFGDSASQRYLGYVDYIASDDHKAIGHLLQSVFYLLDGLSNLFSISGIGYPALSLSSMCSWPVFGCGFGWEDIFSAWSGASKEGRLWTVLCIDEMRRIVWDERFISFRIPE